MDKSQINLILIHGLKKHNENVFGEFEKFLQENEAIKKFNIINFYYYDNLDKNTINHKLFKEEINKILKEHSDKETYVLSYSMGSTAALTLTSNFPNITKIYALVPVFKITQGLWIKKIFTNLKKAKKLKKKLGKERYLRLKALKEKGGSEKYPIRLITQIDLFRKKNKKEVKNLKNKKIKIIFSTNDEINNLKETIKYINQKINYNDNDIEVNFTKKTHFSLLSKDEKRYFDIIKFFEVD